MSDSIAKSRARTGSSILTFLAVSADNAFRRWVKTDVSSHYVDIHINPPSNFHFCFAIFPCSRKKMDWLNARTWIYFLFHVKVIFHDTQKLRQFEKFTDVGILVSYPDSLSLCVCSSEVVTLPPKSICFVLGLIVQLLDISCLSWLDLKNAISSYLSCWVSCRAHRHTVN